MNGLKLVNIEKNGSTLLADSHPMVVKNPEGYIHLRVGFLTIVGGLIAICLVLFQAEAKIVIRYLLFSKGILANPQTQLFLEKGCKTSGGIVIPSHQPAPENTIILPGGNKCQKSNF